MPALTLFTMLATCSRILLFVAVEGARSRRNRKVELGVRAMMEPGTLHVQQELMDSGSLQVQQECPVPCPGCLRTRLIVFWLIAIATFIIAAAAVSNLALRFALSDQGKAREAAVSNVFDSDEESESSVNSEEERQRIDTDFNLGRGSLRESSTVTMFSNARAVFASQTTLASRKSAAHETAAQRRAAHKKKLRQRFKAQWLNATWKHQLRENATALFLMCFVVVAYRFFRKYWYIRHIRTFADLFQADLLGTYVLTLIMGGAAFCVINPEDRIYWPLFFLYCFWILACPLTPFDWSCKELDSIPKAKLAKDWYMAQALRQVDCSPQGLTAETLVFGTVLVFPWLVPRFKLLRQFGWVFIAAHFVWVFVYSLIMKEEYLRPHEQVIHGCLLFIMLGISVVKKFFLEKSQRNKFVQDLRRKHALQRMYTYFRYMVPEHVIVPMITNPNAPIAEHVGRVSILFIVISDFDRFVQKYTPEELLKFLNNTYSVFDEICDNTGVTKIETVGEEYVACVGVVPSDIQLAAKRGHQEVLKKLFVAADNILSNQTDDVQFKMGVHTGPVVAGVIGRKLPRYRLFGDTINTAARMMQKGLTGKLQFGEETYRELPAEIVAQPRGEIDMKGKGKVMTYFFDSIQEQSSVMSLKGEFRRAKTICQLYRDDTGQLSTNLQEEDINTTFAQRRSAEVEDIIDEVTLLSKEFDLEMEREWLKEDHEGRFCKKINVRIWRQICGYSLVTLFELCFVAYEKIVVKHDRRYFLELHAYKFMVYRLLAVGVLFVWQKVIVPTKSLLNDPVEAPILSVVTACLIATISFFSYSSIISTPADAALAVTPCPDSEEIVRRHVPFDQFFSVDYTVLYYLIVGHLNVRFKHSLVFVGLAIVLTAVSWSLEDYVLSFPVQCRMLFIFISLTNSMIARVTEQSSRARFKAQRQVKMTEAKIEGILNTLMPPLVVEKLRKKTVDAPPPTHQYSFVTIAQSDLCGFTKLASSRTPAEIVEFMSDLFGQFDRLTDIHEIYKVETVGDAYIAGAAERPLTARNCPVHVINFGLAMVDAVRDWALNLNVGVNCRVGVHHGECIGGIVGNAMQRYHLFGDLLHGVEILESTAPEGKVQVSAKCREIIEKTPDWADANQAPVTFSFTMRDENELCTSKGEVHDYEEVGGRSSIVNQLSVSFEV